MSPRCSRTPEQRTSSDRTCLICRDYAATPAGGRRTPKRWTGTSPGEAWRRAFSSEKRRIGTEFALPQMAKNTGQARAIPPSPIRAPLERERKSWRPLRGGRAESIAAGKKGGKPEKEKGGKPGEKCAEAGQAPQRERVPRQWQAFLLTRQLR